MRSPFSLRASTTLAVKMSSDALIFTLAYLLAFEARLDWLKNAHLATFLTTLPFVVGVKLLIHAYFGSYRSSWRYCSIRDAQTLAHAALASCAAIVAMGFLLPARLPFPRGIPFIDLAIALLFALVSRASVRLIHEAAPSATPQDLAADLIVARPIRKTRRVLVVGAGDGGEMVVREMFRNRRMDYDPVAFVDDNPKKIGRYIHGVPVLGKTSDIPRLVEQRKIQEILIAIPSARGRDIKPIVDYCRNTAAVFKIVPDLSRIQDGQLHLNDLRSVEVEDLLGRETAHLDLSMISAYVRGKRILVTGAGGSIGAELCRQILKFGPAEIQLMGRGENSIYEIHRELANHAGFTRLVQIIGDVINKKKLEGIFAMYRPQIIFHAGADKHVPLMEMNPDEAVFNNIVGTKNVLEVADAYRVERVVCISTDKAVNPTSVMGCCKRVAELLIRSKMYHNTIAVAVRFGNVLGSRGSVIPHFRKQIEGGGPITVTHRDIRRFFMTIPEAAGLVIQAGAMGRGGEIFVLDMGEPVKIWDLAENMVRLLGLEPGRDVEIKETGLRAGEKLHEELNFSHERLLPTTHPKITCVEGEGVDRLRLLAEIKNLTDRALRMDFVGIRTGLGRVVPEYQPNDEPQPATESIAVGGIQ